MHVKSLGGGRLLSDDGRIRIVGVSGLVVGGGGWWTLVVDGGAWLPDSGRLVVD